MKATVEDVYSAETLLRLQQVELDIYKKFKTVCEKHNLRYYAYAGTLLGAIRHKGIIPWDDDIDVAMPRADYEKMLKIICDELGDDYELMNADISLEYPFVTSRLMKKGTEFRTLSMKDCKCELGIFLDIFCVDNIANNRVQRFLQLTSCWITEKMYILRCLPFPNLPYRGIKRSIVYCICGVAYPIMKLFPRSFLKNCWQKASSKYQHTQTDHIGHCFGLKQYIYQIDEIYPLTEVPFEDTTIYIPQNYDLILTQIYGDYMTPPPVGRRSYIIPYSLNFGDINEDKK